MHLLATTKIRLIKSAVQNHYFNMGPKHPKLALDKAVSFSEGLLP